MYAIGNEELIGLKDVKKNSLIPCPKCNKKHRLQYGEDKEGNESSTLGYIKCGGDYYLASIEGKLVLGRDK